MRHTPFIKYYRQIRHTSLNKMNQYIYSSLTQSLTNNPIKCDQTPFNPLVSAIQNILLKQSCHLHNLSYSHYYSNCICCSKCFQQRFNHHSSTSKISKAQRNYLFTKYLKISSIEFIITNPLILIISQQQINQLPLEILELALTNYEGLIDKKIKKKSDKNNQKQILTQQKTLLLSILNQIKQKVNQYCNSIIEKYEQFQSNYQDQLYTQVNNLKEINRNYKKSLEELLAEMFQEGSKQRLEEVFEVYKKINQNPYEKLISSVQNISENLQKQCMVDWEELKNLYVKITDESVWNIDKFLMNFSSALSSFQHNDQILQQKTTDNIILPNTETNICQGQYSLNFTQNKLQLFINPQFSSQQEINENLFDSNTIRSSSNKILVSQLNISVDSLYKAYKYRLIGVCYNSLIVMKYPFGRLEIQHQVKVKGCQDILIFQDYLVVLAMNQLIRIQLLGFKQKVIGNGYGNVCYLKENQLSLLKDVEGKGKKTLKKDGYFCCEKLSGERELWQINEDRPLRK